MEKVVMNSLVGGQVNKIISCIIGGLLTTVPYELWIALKDGKISEDEMNKMKDMFLQVLLKCVTVS